MDPGHNRGKAMLSIANQLRDDPRTLFNPRGGGLQESDFIDKKVDAGTSSSDAQQPPAVHSGSCSAQRLPCGRATASAVRSRVAAAVPTSLFFFINNVCVRDGL